MFGLWWLVDAAENPSGTISPSYTAHTNQPNRWWGSLSVRDALRLDYKAFTANTAKAGAIKFGMSSVLVPVEGASVRPMRL